MVKKTQNALRLLKRTKFLTVYTKILETTVVNELLDPFILRPHHA